MTNEEWKKVIDDIYTDMMLNAGFGENVDERNIKTSNADAYDIVVKFNTNVSANVVSAKNHCKESVEKNVYCGDVINTFDCYFEVVSGDEETTRQYIIPYSNLTSVEIHTKGLNKLF